MVILIEIRTLLQKKGSAGIVADDALLMDQEL